MSQRFESRPILVRRAGTATLHGTVNLDWQAQVSFGSHLFCVIAGSVVARNVANQQVLDSIGPENLGALYIAVALIAGLGLVSFGTLAKGADARKVTLSTHIGVASLMALAAVTPPTGFLPVIKYVVMEVSAALTLLVFGMLLGSRFAPREARKIAARVGAGGILGGLAGGGVLSMGAQLLGSRWLFFVSAAFIVAPLFWLLAQLPAQKLGKTVAPANDARELRSLPSYGRWVAISTAVMVATTTLIDYQFRFAAKRWYVADELTAFFGFVILFAGLVTILFQLTLLDRLLDRLGLFATATVMPTALLIAGAAFGLVPSIATLVLLKLVDSGANMSVQQATGGLLLAPLGQRARSIWQSRIEGLAKRGGQAGIGLFLLAFPWPPQEVLPLTLGLCGLWVACIAMTRSRYIRLLTEMLRGKDGAEPEVRAFDGDTVRILEAELLGTPDPNRAALVLHLLHEAGHQTDARFLTRLVQRRAGAMVVIDYLAKFRDVRGLAEHLQHNDAGVAGHALTKLAAIERGIALRHAKSLLLTPGRPEGLRALAAGMLAPQDPAALALATTLSRSSDPAARLAVAEGVRHTDPGSLTDVSELLTHLAHDLHSNVAEAALEAFAKHPSSAGTEVMLRALQRRTTRQTAMRTLASLGAPVVERVCIELLAQLHEPRVASALTWTLGRLASGTGIPALVHALAAPHAEVRLAAAMALNSVKRRRSDLAVPEADIEARYLPELAEYTRLREATRVSLPPSRAARVLRGLLKQRAQASLETLFRLLALLYPEDAVRGALTAIASGDRRQRQLALELLDTLVPPAVRQALAQVEGEAAQKRRAPSPGPVLASLLSRADPFLAGLVRVVLSELGEPVPSNVETSMSSVLIDEVLELQSVGLFAQSSPEDLSELAQLLTTRTVARGTVIFKEGDPADALYLVKEGQVRLAKQNTTVEELGSGEAFGMIAVLDQKPRELTATAISDSELRVLSAEDLHQLLTDRPLFMHSLFRALTGALRSQLDRVALGKKTEVA